MTRKSKRAIERELQKLEASTTDTRFSRGLTETDLEILQEFFAADPEVQREIAERLHEMGPIDPGKPR